MIVNKLGRRDIRRMVFVLLAAVLQSLRVSGDDYATDPNNESLLIAAGCFWCVEQAFEQYAPGVVEAVSGYAGADGIDDPTYRNHPGHFEVVLIEYDPKKSTYELMVEYAWRNLDPFDGGGQYCDRGPSYYPAIFYATDEERAAAEWAKQKILNEYPDWDASLVVVPLLERPTFWTAEEYHQDYYIKNPRNYGYYKQRCGRTNRLKEVWGEDEYYCYHDLDSNRDCFNGTVVNVDGDEVEIEVNRKDAAEEVAGLMPTWAVTLVSVVAAILACGLIVCCGVKCKRKTDNNKEEGTIPIRDS